MMMLPGGQAVPVLPGPVPSVINVRPAVCCNSTSYSKKLFRFEPVCIYLCIQLARPMCMVPNIPGIPGPPLGGSSSGSNSPSGYSNHSEAKMVSIRLAVYFYLFIRSFRLRLPSELCLLWLSLFII